MRINNLKNSWIAYDMGNSAHALLVTTIGFSIYFKNYLYNGASNSSSNWAILTTLILIISATLTPFLATYAYAKKKRAILLLITSLLCIIPTFLLGTALSEKSNFAIPLYIISAIGYYISLPIYNSFITGLHTNNLQKTSAEGWGWGYIGGIISALICLLLGLLNTDVNINPELFKKIFIVASLFNLIFSLPIIYKSFKIEKSETHTDLTHRSNLNSILSIFREKPNITKLFMSYWLVGEIATVTIYFFAIFMSLYANASAKNILFLSLFIQIIGFFTTIYSGWVVSKIGPKKTLFVCIFIWVLVPISLFLVSKGISYWFSVVLIGIVIGSYNSIFRGELAEISETVSDSSTKGSLWGFFDLSGRFSQILSPLFIAIFTLFTTLNNVILFTLVFPIASYFVIRKYNWSQK